eukprot:9876376-Lingulodinium_polyedra.AAC.1
MLRALFTTEKVPALVQRADRAVEALKKKNPNMLRGFHMYRQHLSESMQEVMTEGGVGSSSDQMRITSMAWTLYKALPEAEREEYERQAERRREALQQELRVAEK